MNNGFPTVTRSALTGEVGVTLVARVVGTHFGWMFRRNHGEHDFGIDGYIDVITSDGSVTGRCLAVQIKCGDSYFAQKDEYGYVYHGQQKHLNYLINHPLPTIVVLCNPNTGICYWEHFRVNAIEPTASGWKLCVPFEQTLDRGAQQRLETIAGPAHDHTEQLREYWKTNEAIASAPVVICPVERKDIESGANEHVVQFLDRLCATKAFAKRTQGKVELTVSGYSDDSRALWQIPAVVAWMKAMERRAKYWFYFMRTDDHAEGLRALAFCVCDAKRIEGMPADSDGRLPFKLDDRALEGFLLRNFAQLNELAARLSLPEAELKRISFAAVRSMGFGTPDCGDGDV